MPLLQISHREQEGDVILTGTPEGVGPVDVGDKVTAGLIDTASGSELTNIEFNVIQRNGYYQFTADA